MVQAGRENDEHGSIRNDQTRFDLLSSSPRYGWFGWRPACLQFNNRPAWYLVFFCAAAFAQSLVCNGFIDVSMSSLQTQFNLKSGATGWIPSAYELSGIFVLLFASFISNSVNRPCWQSGGIFLLSLGSLLFALPHFISSPYEYTEESIEKYCANQSAYCFEKLASENAGNSVDYLAIFIVAAILLSIGANLLYLLGVPYLDDGVTHGQSSLYLSIFYAMTSVGPAVAYIAGGAVLLIYTDFDRVDMNEITITADDPQWVGAWWIGFLFAFVMLLLLVPPFAGYNPSLPMTAELIKERNNGRTAGTDEFSELSAQRGFGESLKDILPSLKRLATNPVYVLVVIASVGDGLLIVGFSTFGPTYVENQFSLSAATAGIIFGAITVPGAAGGSIFGGWTLKHFKFTLNSMLRILCLTHIISLVMVLSFFIRCDNPPFAGVNVPAEINGTLATGVSSACNAQCGCELQIYDPQCGTDGVIYYSPCYAGCQNHVSSYGNCNCLRNGEGIGQSGAVTTLEPGFCAAPGCNLVPLFFACFFLAMFTIFVGGMYGLQIILRCVAPRDRPAALGWSWTFIRAFGTTVGPLLFGSALDQSCILWNTKCDATTGSCLYYDNRLLALIMLFACVGCKSASVVSSSASCLVYREPVVRPVHVSTTTASITVTEGDLSDSTAAVIVVHSLYAPSSLSHDNSDKSLITA